MLPTHKVPIYVGVSGNSTRKVIDQIENLNRYDITGYLVTSPYYNLPSQQGIFEHFAMLADATDKQILIYNIPYRTGRNVENETILRLSKIPNIVGIKDSCGIVSQSTELLRDRDPRFAVFTGEDMLFYFNIVSGGNGGILASAHLQTDRFVSVWELVQELDLKTALLEWNKLTKMIPLLFTEPNPAPIKYILAKKGIIASPELRPPMGTISERLKNELDRFISEKPSNKLKPTPKVLGVSKGFCLLWFYGSDTAARLNSMLDHTRQLICPVKSTLQVHKRLMFA